MKKAIFIILVISSLRSFGQLNTINDDDVIDTLFAIDMVNTPNLKGWFASAPASSQNPNGHYVGNGGNVIFKPTISGVGTTDANIGNNGDGLNDSIVVNIIVQWRPGADAASYNDFDFYIDDKLIGEIDDVSKKDNQRSVFSNVKIPEDLDSIYFSFNSFSSFIFATFTKVSPTISAITEEVSSMAENDFTIYPNPIAAGEEMSIQLSPAMNANLSSVAILAASGDIVASYASIQELTTRNLTQGVYFVILKSKDGTMTTNKLIVR